MKDSIEKFNGNKSPPVNIPAILKKKINVNIHT